MQIGFQKQNQLCDDHGAHLRDNNVDRLKDREGGKLQSIALMRCLWLALGLNT